jgi:hypothetical protein
VTALSLPMSNRLITYHLAARPDHARVILPPGQLMRLPEDVHAVRVLAGHAWITHEGRDIVLDAGNEYLPASDRDFTLVSAVGDVTLELEIRSQT